MNVSSVLLFDRDGLSDIWAIFIEEVLTSWELTSCQMESSTLSDIVWRGRDYSNLMHSWKNQHTFFGSITNKAISAWFVGTAFQILTARNCHYSFKKFESCLFAPPQLILAFDTYFYTPYCLPLHPTLYFLSCLPLSRILGKSPTCNFENMLRHTGSPANFPAICFNLRFVSTILALGHTSICQIEPKECLTNASILSVSLVQPLRANLSCKRIFLLLRHQNCFPDLIPVVYSVIRPLLWVESFDPCV